LECRICGRQGGTDFLDRSFDHHLDIAVFVVPKVERRIKIMRVVYAPEEPSRIFGEIFVIDILEPLSQAPFILDADVERQIAGLPALGYLADGGIEITLKKTGEFLEDVAPSTGGNSKAYRVSIFRRPMPEAWSGKQSRRRWPVCPLGVSEFRSGCSGLRASGWSYPALRQTEFQLPKGTAAFAEIFDREPNTRSPFRSSPISTLSAPWLALSAAILKHSTMNSRLRSLILACTAAPGIDARAIAA
jgi:hypothetical protein